MDETTGTLGCHVHFKMVGNQLDDEQNLYSREMLGNHHFHPLKNWLELEFQVDIVRFGRKQKVDSGIRGYGKVPRAGNLLWSYSKMYQPQPQYNIYCKCYIYIYNIKDGILLSWLIFLH